MRKILATILTIASFTIASPAGAVDNTWITYPSIAAVKMTGGEAKVTGVGYQFSAQAQTVALRFQGTPDQAGKFAQINFFDFVGGIGVELTAGASGVSSTACDHQTLGGNKHTCYFKLDSAAKASIPLNFSKVSTAARFKYKVLSGPNIAESSDGIVSFAAPTNKVVAVLNEVRGISGGPGFVQFKVSKNGKATAGVLVRFSYSGIGENLSVVNATSDKKGLVTAFLTNLKFSKGSTKIVARVVGGKSVATATVRWFRVKYL